MRRLATAVFFLWGLLATQAFAQANELPRDTIPPAIADSLAAPQDTTQEETRRQRRARERMEREAAEETIFKDSARLAIEALTRKAWKRSAIVPGWGQYTNGGLWWIKVPVIYGGYVTAGLVFEFNHRYYKEILSEVQFRMDNNDAFLDPLYQNYNTQSLINAKDFYRRNRDLTVLITVGWHALNAIEAYVDSMLKNRWSISDDLSFDISPTLIPNPPQAYAYSPYSAGFKVTFSLH